MTGASFAERALAAVPRTLLDERSPKPAPEGAVRPVAELCREALSSPIDSEPLAAIARGASRIAVIVSDATREEPRAEMLEVLSEILPWERVTLVVSSGTHAPTPPDERVIPSKFRHQPIVVHDSKDESALVDLGRTDVGTRVRIHRAVALADLVVCTGRLRPHYFAGYSGGVKGIFPGCAHAEDALGNHRLKTSPSARLGNVEDNVCRGDMEQAASLVPGVVHILNVLADVDGSSVAAAAGHPISAHRFLARRAQELFSVSAPRSRVVCVADRPPVSASLYQASKLIAPAAAILEPGGSVIVVADCASGVGPLERVNEGIYGIGLRPKLPREHRIFLASELDEATVKGTYATSVSSARGAIESELARHAQDRAILIWRAGECIVEAELAPR